MPYFHGFKVTEAPTSVPTPQVVPSGIPFVVGTSPVQSVGAAGKVNVPVLANTFEEAVAALGYSDDWETYTLCEFMYSHFQLFKKGPVILVNVLDPTAAAMKEAVAAADKSVTNHQAKLPIGAIDNAALVVKAEGGAGAAYVKDTDYEVFYDGEYCVVEMLPGSDHYAEASLNIAYEQVKISGVTATEIVGGYDTETHVTAGIECINQVLALHGIIPDILLAPGWSHNTTVAAALTAKAAGIHGLFKCKALVDIQATSAGADYYSEAPTQKTANGWTDKNYIVGWPLGRAGDRIFHMSALIAGLIAQVDAANGCPYESPSNKALPIDSIVVDNGDGTYGEVILSIDEANILNAAGIVTALRAPGGFTLWGNYTAAYPGSSDPQDIYIPVSRMAAWLGKNVILAHWAKLDKPFTPVVAASIENAINLWLNGLTGEQKLLGGRIEFLPEDNALSDLLAGKAKWRIHYAAPVPGEQFHFLLAYDISYLTAAFASE
jgi:phage tail sheath protein FI